MLSNFFGLDNPTPVLGRNMLMIPIIKATNAAHKNENIEHLISKQHFFYAQMEYSKTFDFTELDRPNKITQQTAQDMVMKFRTLDGSDSKLFWSVDKDNSGAYHLAYTSHIAEHARNLVAQLPSLLRFAFGKEALKVLSAAAVKKALAAPWDPVKMRAISKEDKKLEAMIIATDNMMNGLEEEEISDVDSDDDSINTKDELDGADDRATERYLFQQASSNASITTLDTHIGSSKPNHIDDSKYHEIAPSPTKKRKEHHSESEDEDENSAVDNMDTDDNND